MSEKNENADAAEQQNPDVEANNANEETPLNNESVVDPRHRHIDD